MLKQLTSLAAAVAFAATASAGASYGFSSITNNNAGDVAIGEAQFCVEVIDTDENTVEFYFTNAGPEASSMVQLYWEDSLNLLTNLNGWGTTTPTSLVAPYGVDFGGGSANPAHAPGSNPFIDDYSIQAAGNGNGKSKAGVGVGEDVSVFFSYTGTYAALLEAIDNGDLVIALHAQAFASGGSESFVSVPKGTPPSGVPSPTAALAGVGLLGLMASRRRRG